MSVLLTLKSLWSEHREQTRLLGQGRPVTREQFVEGRGRARMGLRPQTPPFCWCRLPLSGVWAVVPQHRQTCLSADWAGGWVRAEAH